MEMTDEYFERRLEEMLKQKGKVPSALKEARKKVLVNGMVVRKDHLLHRFKTPDIILMPDKIEV
jgi:hypothetical protein